jgi:ribose transport system substrate-binding protein
MNESRWGVSRPLRSVRWLTVPLALATACAVAGCTSTSTPSTSTSTPSASGTASADVAAAQQFLAPYSNGREPAFPVTTPLKVRPPADSTYAYLDCSTPVCAIFKGYIQAATEALGVKFLSVYAGSTVTSEQNAMSTIIADKPQGVFIPAIDPDAVLPQLKQLKQLGIPVTSQGIVNAPNYDIEFDNDEQPSSQELAGQIMAAWVIVKKGAAANAVIYNVPELAFSNFVAEGFTSEMAKLCSSCTARVVNIPVDDIGTSAPSLVVSDLEAHPQTNVAAFTVDEAATGLPSALKVAGINITLTGNSPTPEILEYVKDGEMTSALGQSQAIGLWLAVDALARLQTHQPLAPGEPGTPIVSMLDAQNITPAMVSGGWNGYNDYASLFEKLWHP